MIDELKNENIKFKEISEKEALNYLKQNNNYYNICLYKNLFEKYYINGEYINKYIDLDFAYLKDLAIIDFELRLLLYNMISDVEHYLKFRLLKFIGKQENKVVKMYLKSKRFKNIKNKFDINISLNQLLDIIPFGKLVDFYEFIVKVLNLKNEKKYIIVLKEIVTLRNRVYHNDKILVNLNENSNNYVSNFIVLEYLKKCNIDKDVRNLRISNPTIRQLTCLFYIFNIFVTSIEVKDHVNKLLNDFMFERVVRNKKYFINNELLKQIYIYFEKIITKEFANSH